MNPLIAGRHDLNLHDKFLKTPYRQEVAQSLHILPNAASSKRVHIGNITTTVEVGQICTLTMVADRGSFYSKITKRNEVVLP